MELENYTEDDFLRDYDEGYDWPDDLWHEILYGEFGEYITTEYAEELDRWSRGATTIFRIKGRYFACYWQQGLTEYQESEYCGIHEVIKHEYQKTITVTEWKEI